MKRQNDTPALTLGAATPRSLSVSLAGFSSFKPSMCRQYVLNSQYLDCCGGYRISMCIRSPAQ
jgi:hypothetical protein